MRAPLLTAVTLCACSGELDVRLELPVEPAHRSVIVAIGDEPREVHAAPLIDGEIETPIVADVEAAEQVVALFYGRTLGQLGVPSGRLTSSDDGRALPGPDLVLRSGLEEDWQPAQFPEPLVSFRFVGVEGCTVFANPEPFPLGGSGRVTALLPEEDSVIATTADFFADSGRVLRVHANGAVDVLSSGPAIYAAYQDGAGDLWMAGTGAVYRGVLNGDSLSVTLSSSTTVPGPVRVLIGDRTSAGPGVQFASTATDTVERFDGANWSILDRSERDLGCVYAVARISDEEAIIGWDEALVVGRWRDGRVTEEVIPANNLTNGVSEVEHLPGYATIIGTKLGEIIRMREGEREWAKIEGTYAAISVRDLALYPGGFLYVDDRSVAVQHRDGVGYCEPLLPSLRVDGGDHSIAAVGRDVVVGGLPPTGGEPLLFWFRAE